MTSTNTMCTTYILFVVCLLHVFIKGCQGQVSVTMCDEFFGVVGQDVRIFALTDRQPSGNFRVNWYRENTTTSSAELIYSKGRFDDGSVIIPEKYTFTDNFTFVIHNAVAADFGYVYTIRYADTAPEIPHTRPLHQAETTGMVSTTDSVPSVLDIGHSFWIHAITSGFIPACQLKWMCMQEKGASEINETSGISATVETNIILTDGTCSVRNDTTSNLTVHIIDSSYPCSGIELHIYVAGVNIPQTDLSWTTKKQEAPSSSFPPWGWIPIAVGILLLLIGCCFGCYKCYMYYKQKHYTDLVSGKQGVTDEALTASSIYNAAAGPTRARLNSKLGNGVNGSWSPKTETNEWIQVKFAELKVITAIKTKGRNGHPDNHHVKTYTMSYSTDCTTWTQYENNMVFNGNSDPDTVVKNALPTPVIARCVRLYPKTYNIWPDLRFDIEGCSTTEDPGNKLASVVIGNTAYEPRALPQLPDASKKAGALEPLGAKHKKKKRKKNKINDSYEDLNEKEQQEN